VGYDQAQRSDCPPDARGDNVNHYACNTFAEIAAALNDGKTQFLLRAGQMRQIVDVHNAVVEAKNDVTRENWQLTERLKTTIREEA